MISFLYIIFDVWHIRHIFHVRQFYTYRWCIELLMYGIFGYQNIYLVYFMYIIWMQFVSKICLHVKKCQYCSMVSLCMSFILSFALRMVLALLKAFNFNLKFSLGLRHNWIFEWVFDNMIILVFEWIKSHLTISSLLHC